MEEPRLSLVPFDPLATDSMELVLWRWSTAVQVSSALLIAVFFLVLGRTSGRAESRPLAWAWAANLAALAVTVAFWFLQPTSAAAAFGLEAGYFFAKPLFMGLLLLAAWRFSGGTTGPVGIGPVPVAALAAFALAASLLSDSIATMGVVVASVMALGCGAGAALLLVRRTEGAAWLVVGFVARAALGAVEAGSYAASAADGPVSSGTSLFLAAHSSLDTGAEWVIALGCVLLLHQTIQRELLATNEDLLATQEALRGMVDRDPLTGLANRRTLPAVLRTAWDSGATLLFFDLDDFKQVNDRRGHDAGDAVLVRFAEALRAAFRPGDHVIRYAGDEFVVVAPGAEPSAVLARLDALRARLDGGGEPAIRFTAGHARLDPGGDPDEALRAADAAMYARKEAKRGGDGGALASAVTGRR